LIKPGKGSLPIFFVHDGLGEVLLYRSLAMKLGNEHPVYGLEPEVSGGTYTHTRIVDMAHAKIERVRAIQPQGPYLLAGLCAGGVIAFELARQLQDQGEQVAFVGIIDAADVAAKERRFRIARERLGRFLGTLRPQKGEPAWSVVTARIPALVSKAVNMVRYEIARKLELKRNARKVAALRGQVQTQSTQVNELGFIKLYEIAHREHIAQGVLEGAEVVLFRATQGTGGVGDVPFKEIYADPVLGWGPRVNGPVHVVDVPGGHSSALQEPNVEELAQAMRKHIDIAVAAG
jgi:thioesterase domain-containing protein